MRSPVHLVACLALILLGTGNFRAIPQEREKLGKTAEANAMQEGEREIEPKAEAANKDEDEETSVTLPRTAGGLGERFLQDQQQIWTSPTRLRWADANWLLPLSGVSAGLFVTDADMSRHISHNPTTVLYLAVPGPCGC
jgi:hypothetical protein